MLQRAINICKRIEGLRYDLQITERWLGSRWPRSPWLPTLDPMVELPVDCDALSKQDDPSWRKNQKWVRLYKVGKIESFRVIYMDDKEIRRSGRVHEKNFIMRVGPDPIRVMIQTLSGTLESPGIYDSPSVDGPTILSFKEMITLLRTTPVDFTVL